MDIRFLRDEIEGGLRHFERELDRPFPSPSDLQLGQLRRYLDTLGLWRARLSLVSTEDPVEILRNHVIDSLAVLPWAVAGARVADLGSGAGFPGIPLAIFQPEAHVTLIEARRRRASFLAEAIRQCGLENVDVLERRAEDVGTRFDVIFCRAFASIEETLRLGTPLTQPGGRIVSMKGERSVEQVFEAGHPAQILAYSLPTGEPRRLVVHQVG